MKARITKIATSAYFDTDEPGSEIRIWATLDTPITRPAEPYNPGDEVTAVEFSVYSDDEHVFKPLRPGTTWVQPKGYVLTKKGTRNKTNGYGRLRRDLSASEEAAIILSLLKDPNLPEALRGDVEEVAA